MHSVNKTASSVIDRSATSVTPVDRTEPGHARPVCSASGATKAADGWPGEPNEDWFDDPDAYYDEVVEYMNRLYASCESSDEFLAALKGLFPELQDKVARARAMATEEFDEGCEPDADADIAAGRTVFYPSSAEFLASLMADEFQTDCA